MEIEETKILFLCSENAVRSPIAEALMKRAAGPDIHVVSAGVHATQIHPFAIAVMMEQDINLMDHVSHDYNELENQKFDLIVALSPEAWDLAREIAQQTGAAAEYWNTPTPPSMSDSANREQILEAYRRIRDDIARHISNRFNFTMQ